MAARVLVHAKQEGNFVVNELNQFSVLYGSFGQLKRRAWVLSRHYPLAHGSVFPDNLWLGGIPAKRSLIPPRKRCWRLAGSSRLSVREGGGWCGAETKQRLRSPHSGYARANALSALLCTALSLVSSMARYWTLWFCFAALILERPKFSVSAATD